MATIEKILQEVLSGVQDSNIKFNSLLRLFKHLGFSQRIRGDHHILFKDGVEEIINLQPLGSKCKNYQVKQVRNLIHKYKMYT